MRRLHTVSLMLLSALLASACSTLPTHGTTRPTLIAHRGGTGDAPENTLVAIDTAIANHADALWLSVQLSADGVPVLYRPADLDSLTNAKGPVSAWNADALALFNAGTRFKTADGKQPYRDKGPGIPTLDEALKRIPANLPVYLDLKSEPAQPLINAISAVLDAQRAWQRVRFYSTQKATTQALANVPQAQVFEDRDATRNRIATLALSGQCQPPAPGTWSGIELKRVLNVGETFTLGTVSSQIPARLWTRASVECFRKAANTHIVMFGIDTAEDLQTARELGADAILGDSPAALRRWLP